MAAAGIALGVQYAHNEYQKYQAAKAYRAAHAPTADQAGKVSPANHGYVRKVTAASGNFTRTIDPTGIGKDVKVYIEATGDPTHPLPRPYEVDVYISGGHLKNPVDIVGPINTVERFLPNPPPSHIHTKGGINYITIIIYGQGGERIPANIVDTIGYQGTFNYLRTRGTSGM